MTFAGRELRSLIAADGTLTLSLDEVVITDPADDEVIVRIEAAPINPSDLTLLLGPADVSTMQQAKSANSNPTLTFLVPPRLLNAPAGRPDQTAAGRIGQSLVTGLEGAGTVVAAGKKAEGYIGKLVGMSGAGLYADYLKTSAQEVTILPPGATAHQGAAMVVNPLTALGFVETARKWGHSAIIQTAAASSVGQMLQRICLADGIPLVNIVRSPKQVELMRGIGADIVLNSNDENFREDLISAIDQTGATIAFDPTGGGSLGSELLEAIEQTAYRKSKGNGPYISDTFKQLFIYGFLEEGPTLLNWAFMGDEWSVAGWRLPPFLRKTEQEIVQRMKERVARELTTTFANNYSRVIGLAEALQPEVLRAYHRKSTGEKFLIDPMRG